jgi:predicted Ser/Thr protein kinase
MIDIREVLAQVGAAVRHRYEAERRVLSFEEYLDLVAKHPARHTRDAARYVRDCLDHFGSYEVARPTGTARRYRLFDLPFEDEHDGARREFLVGQEHVQETLYRTLSNFAREGRSNRLLLLHGPNGSAKSTFAACVLKGLEAYSALDEGAAYTFSWIFPRGVREGAAIGFGGGGAELAPGDSYAHLADGQIDAKLASPLREHPLQLLPVADRRALVAKLYADAGVTEAAPDWIHGGQLGHRNQQILHALLVAYRGDLRKVLAHVQVERFTISRRYRVGAVTIGPQMAVDAAERQITADRSLSALPASLSSLTLFDVQGELVDASGGVLEYSDLLKRPLDAWKYLLLAIETGETALSQSTLPLNLVMIASSNELHLGAFREHPEFNSFRGRLTLVRSPYLVDYTLEQQIYDTQLVPQIRRHVAPHATYTAALWAVLTRLRRPRADKYEPAKLGRIASELTPLEKAELYARGAIPQRLSGDEAKVLHVGIPAVFEEAGDADVYEGVTGASPREVRMLLLDAAQNGGRTCLSPLGVLDRLEELCEKGDYEFLKEKPEGGYQSHREFIAQVRQRWLDRVDDEVRTATGLVDETQYTELFERYVSHVSYWVKNERVYNKITGKTEEPDTELMHSIEKTLDVGKDPTTFRRDLISSVAAHAIDHPGQKVDFASVFPRHLARVKEAYFADRKKQLGTIVRDALGVLGGDTLEDENRRAADTTLATLRSKFGYCDGCARDALGELVKARYAEG